MELIQELGLNVCVDQDYALRACTLCLISLDDHEISSTFTWWVGDVYNVIRIAYYDVMNIWE